MTNNEMIKILRDRTARAILNYCFNTFGVSGFKHKNKIMPFSENELTLFLIEQIEDCNRNKNEAKQAELLIIDAYSNILSEESTGELVKLSDIKLSNTGIRVVSKVFGDMVDQLIERGLA